MVTGLGLKKENCGEVSQGPAATYLEQWRVNQLFGLSGEVVSDLRTVDGLAEAVVTCGPPNHDGGGEHRGAQKAPWPGGPQGDGVGNKL